MIPIAHNNYFMHTNYFWKKLKIKRTMQLYPNRFWLLGIYYRRNYYSSQYTYISMIIFAIIRIRSEGRSDSNWFQKIFIYVFFFLFSNRRAITSKIFRYYFCNWCDIQVRGQPTTKRHSAIINVIVSYIWKF